MTAIQTIDRARSLWEEHQSEVEQLESWWKLAPAFTFVDDFCGAGGSSAGLTEAGGVLVQAANHWAKAIDTHATNFPAADHLQTDLLLYNMRLRPNADVYWASPECTWHSPAGGRKRKRAMLDMFEEHVSSDAGDRSRLTMMQVVAAAEAKRFKIVVVENVVEVADWELFESWLHSMTSLGYSHQILSVSAAHIGSSINEHAPQWRDRVYFIFWQAGINFPDMQPRPLAWCPACSENVHSVQAWKRPDRRTIGKYRQQYNYVCPSDTHKTVIVEPWVLPASAAIDWTDLGTPIRDRKRPLAAATMRRIEVGLRMFAEPLTVAHAGQTWDAAETRHPHFGEPDSYYRVAPTGASPVNARTATPGDGLATPMLFSVNHDGDDPRAFPADASPLPTRSTKLGDAMVVPVGGTWRTDPHHVDGPFRTRTTADDVGIAAPPFMVERRDYEGPDEGRVSSIDGAPLPTMTATGRGVHGIVAPEPFVTMLRANNRPMGTDEPLAGITTGRNHALTVPPGAFLSKHHGGINYPRPNHMNKGVDEPLPTIVAAPNVSLVIPFRRGKAKTTAEPLHTLATRDSAALVQPAIDPMDCSFRMLKWREHATAQRFPRTYTFTGNSSENTMMAGNAVASNVAHYIGIGIRIALGDKGADQFLRLAA
jgi:DNA (cytosine-5)-methyltransferase 1